MIGKIVQVAAFFVCLISGFLLYGSPVGFSLLFVSGIIVLVNGADYLIDGASGAASRLRVSPLLIGLTIVAFGTSFSEVVVSAMASFFGNSGISIGNVVGSNILNIALVLGITAIIYPLAVRKSTIRIETPFMIISGLVMIFLCFNFLDFSPLPFVLGRIDGIIMLLMFTGFIYYVVKKAKEGRETFVPVPGVKKGKTWKLAAMLVLGLAGIFIGAQLIIDSSVGLAGAFGISETIIGLTIVALGTSLPELATNTAAALKRRADIAVGNIVGSNISNTLLVLGIASLIRPIPVNLSFVIFDMAAMMMLFFILMVFIATGKKLSRREGIALIVFYAIYAAYLVFSLLS